MVPFQKITEACKNTGLSQYYLLAGLQKTGTVPAHQERRRLLRQCSGSEEELDKKKSS